MEYKIDATNKILGRLASEIALILRGKNSPAFDPSRVSGNTAVVFNTDKVRVTGKKMTQKLYRRHSGYLGNLKEERMRDLTARDSRLVLRHAVMGMLPKNRLRPRIIKGLVMFKGEEKQRS